MPKTLEEITAAHRRTLEVFTGMDCTIVLTDKKEKILRETDLTQILLAAELFNPGSYAITSNSSEQSTVTARKIFCLLADKAGYSSVKIGNFLERRHTVVLYNLRKGRELLAKDKDFKRLYTNALQEIISKKD